MSKKLRANSFLIFIIILLLVGTAEAGKSGKMINPITDVDWSGIFPVKIGGVTIAKGGGDLSSDTPPDNIKSPVCVCKNTIGLSVSFWEPARISETVKDPYYFPTIGTQLGNSKEGFLYGNSSVNADNGKTTNAQEHWLIFAVWNMLDLFLDFPCLDAEQFDIAYITEVDPTWQDDLLGFILNPEALLFANPIANLACIADSVKANYNYPLSPLFWCMGSWGNAYPLTGTAGGNNEVQANAALASRMIFKLGREMLLWDTGVNVCGKVPTPIWIKENYRLQLARPVRGRIVPIGRSTLLWGSSKNPPFGAGGNPADDFMWIMFRKRVCCAGYSL